MRSGWSVIVPSCLWAKVINWSISEAPRLVAETARSSASAPVRAVDLDHLRDLDRSQHGLQDVAEVVRDAARERPHRFHLLRVPELVFQRPLAGDVADDTDGAQHPSIVALDHEAAAMNPARRPVGTIGSDTSR